MNHDAFPIVADRPAQKRLFDRLHLPTAPQQLLFEHSEWPTVSDCLGELAVAKRHTGGYDGRDQQRLRTDETERLSAECCGECTVEQGINFSGEVSLVDTRGPDDSTAFYPLTHNLHQNGILHTSVAFSQTNAQQQVQAEEMLSTIMRELSYVGMVVMECLITPQGLLINELAPRVYSGRYWTQNGASISQFELHLRAITDLPLPQPVVNNPSVMISLVGSDLSYDQLKLPLMHLHRYDKEARPGRKVGHLSSTDSDTSCLTATLEALIPLLPPEYASGVMWTQSKFSQPGA